MDISNKVFNPITFNAEQPLYVGDENIYIHAKDMGVARRFAREHKIARWKYLYNRKDLYGYVGIVIAVGQYWRNVCLKPRWVEDYCKKWKNEIEWIKGDDWKEHSLNKLLTKIEESE